MRFEEFLRQSAERYPNKTAIVAGERRLTYEEFHRQSDALASALGRHGVSRGDRVVVFMDNSVEAAIAVFGIMKAGAVFSPIHPSTKADKLAYVLQNCRARAILAQAKLAPVASEAMSSSPSVTLAVVTGSVTDGLPNAVSFEDCLEATGQSVNHGGIDVDLAMLIYTSGSTGGPKGVMMTHRNVEAAATSITTYLRNRPDDIILNVLPLSFDYGLYQLLMAVKVGATLVLEKSFAFPQAVFDTMRRERVTGLPLVPTMAAVILKTKSLVPGSFPALRYVTNTAAALPPSHIAQLQALFPDATLYSMYGQTECKRCTWLPPEELHVRPGSVGIAIPNTEAYIVDDTGERVPHGTVGELVIRGPHVMQGYWENEEATRRSLRPGEFPWEKVLYTGDLFRADDQGFLYFLGRKDDIIKSGAMKIAPKEIETVIYACPGVSEVVVVGKPDPVLGESIRAIVVSSDPALTEREVKRHCAQHLEDYMVPQSVEFRDDLPKTDTGKVSRRLAAMSLEAAE